MSEQGEVSLDIAGKKLPLMRLKNTPYGQYVIFPMTRDGLVYSIHPTGNPHLHNKSERLAELDLEAVKQTTFDDLKTLFRYPKHNCDVQVLPVSDSLGAWFGDTVDILTLLNKVFGARVMYVMRARRLPEFFQAKPANYMILDPRSSDRAIMQFKGSPFGPFNLDINKGPRNPRMRNLFSINMGIMKALENVPDTELQDFEPDETTVSQWAAIIKAMVDQVQVIRWKKGGQERLLGTMPEYTAATNPL